MAPAVRSRAEIRLIRLLSRCEEMAGLNTPDDWRLEKYVGALEERLQAVQKLDSSEKPKEDIISEYAKKIKFLKQLLETQKLPVTSEKSLANQLLVPAKSRTIPTNKESPTGKQIQMQASSRYTTEMRDELMLTEKEKSAGVRYRATSSGGSTQNADTEAILQHQHKMHEKIADEMVALTRNLKHNIMASNRVIKDDLNVIEKSSKKADQNYGQLQTESSRLESHLKKGTNWWLWISLALVCAVFMFMIFFIRFFPKRYS
uniref:vesicle transport protein USE1-like n=1 Tax=Styela clava TaxID=7725 RepID=UPI001939505A|nr:vesicle transport protein USE1-like [Styela clava]